MSDHKNNEFPLDWLRHTSPYINTHRGKTFVIWLSGELLNAGNFQHLVHDLTLLSHLGVRLILVHGMRPQIDAELATQDISPRFARREDGNTSDKDPNLVRITGSDVLPALKNALGQVRSQIESAFTTGLPNTPMSGAQATLCSGNFVVAKPYGVRDGVDFGHTGEIRKVRVNTVKNLLDLGLIVLLSPVGYSPTGEMFNLHAEDVATQTAIALGAEKLIFLHEHADSIADGGSTSTREISAQSFANAQSLTVELKPLEFVIKNSLIACRNGVRRCHIVSSKKDGALLKELFTRDGSGLLIDSGSYDTIRPAATSDVAGIKELIQPLIDDGILRDRTEQDLEREIQDFYIAERDGSVICCASLTLYGTQAELGCLAVHSDFRASGKAAEIVQHLIREAKLKNCHTIFALTTRSGDWFQEQGFIPGKISTLPEERDNITTKANRGSKLFALQLN